MTNNEHLTDDEVLIYTQNKRRAVINDIVKDGLPSDNRDRTVLLSALTDMDRSALTNKRLGAQQKSSDADRIAAMAIAKFNSGLAGKNPFEQCTGETINGRPMQQDLEKLDPVETVPGETDVGLSDLNYDSFMSMMDEKD